MLRSMTVLAIAAHRGDSTPSLGEDSMFAPASLLIASCHRSILIAHAIHQGLSTPIRASSRDVIGRSQDAWRWLDESVCTNS